jgi:hypothetical protein
MRYSNINTVTVVGLRGTMYVETARDTNEVSIQADGPYETCAVGDSQVIIYPEGQEPVSLLRGSLEGSTEITTGGPHVGSVEATTSVQLDVHSSRVKARASASVRATVRVMAPPNTSLELIRCRGLRKGPRGWHFMQGTSRLTIR